ncbi:ABC transporter permease [Lentibacillus saliphilus]|uniref:ABC transporter permease n=1 Tax=Lentibacillus saliphilus TaxID=2737028 RepID=UPI001C3073C1|nr:ABC transporter permease subunit [Lentibacillus saliphilus]
MKLFPFEFKKMVLSRKFSVLLLIIVACVIALFIRNVAFQPVITENALKDIDDQLQTSDMLLRVHQYKLEEDPENEVEKELKDMLLANINLLNNIKNAVSTDQWQERLIQENALLKGIATYNEAGGEFPLDTSEIVRQYALNEKLLDEHIKPESSTYSMAFPNFMKQVLDFLFHLGAIIMMVILIGDLMTAELEDHSAKFLLTQPLKRRHIITSKFWTAISAYITVLVVLFLTITIIGSIFGNEGTFQYPILIEKNGELAFMTIIEYITFGAIGVSALMITVISLYLFYSLYLKQTVSTLFALLGTLLLGYVATTFISWRFFAWLNPFQYIIPREPLLFQNGTAWYQGLPILFLLSVIFYGLAVRKIKTLRIG